MATTWNPNDKSTNITLSNNNLTGVGSLNSYVGMKATTQGKPSSKFYYEIKINSVSSRILIGLANESIDTGDSYGVSATNIPIGIRGLINTGIIYNSNTTVSNGTYSTNDTIGISFDRDTGQINFYKNGTFIYTVNVSQSNIWFPYVILSTSGDSITANFGDTAFEYDIPDGYVSYSGIVSKTLLQSNNKTYSLESIDTWYETKMTSNTTLAPFVASASSEKSGSYPAWKAFDGLVTHWDSKDNNANDEWIQINYGIEKKANKLNLIAPSSYPERMPKKIEILGSNNGTTFSPITTIQDEKPWIVKESRVYHFNNFNKYKIYRIKIPAHIINTTTVRIAEITFGYAESIMNLLPFSSQQNFIDYGMESNIKVDGIFTNKNYILQDSISKDVDGLWKTQLDRKPLSISFN